MLRGGGGYLDATNYVSLLVLRPRPRDMLSHQRARMPVPRLKCGGDRWRRWRVAQGDSDISQPALMANAANRAALQTLVELSLSPGEQLDEGRRIESISRLKIRDRRALRKFVPRADELAVVAAVNAVAHRFAELYRYRAFEFDGQITDAFARIEPVGPCNGLGGANVDAGRASAAMVVLSAWRGKFERGVDFAQKKH